MSKLRQFTFLFLLLFAINTQAQWATSGTNINSTNTGNVGIGITAPEAKLDVAADGSSLANMLRIGNTTGRGLYLGGATSATVSAIIDFRNGNVGTRYLDFRGDGVSRMVLTAAGNLGIGTVSPSHKLEISTDANEILDAIRIGSNSLGYNGGRILFKGAGGANIGQIEGSFSPSGTGDLLFRGYNSGMSTIMTLKGQGNVGVGTSNPQAKMHVYGTNPMILIEGDANSYYPKLRMKSVGGDGFLDNFNLTSALTGGINMQAQASGGRVSLGVTPSLGAVSFSDNPALITHRVIGAPGQTADIFHVSQFTGPSIGIFQTTPVLKITATGNVGIGISNAVPYKLAVNGTIGAKKVKVTQETWADYVFEPSYQLPTLKEVETFIIANKHLPGVPSATEVKEAGLDLGDNQAVLLKKIEELTLYIIQQQKEIEALKAKMK